MLALFLAEVALARNLNSIGAASFAGKPIALCAGRSARSPQLAPSSIAHDLFARAPATWGACLEYRRTSAAQIEERHDRLLHLMQSLDGFPDERIVDRGRIAVHKVVASGLHLPDMCRDLPVAEGRQVGFQRGSEQQGVQAAHTAADGGVTLQKIAPDTLGQGWLPLC
jgi:hypothetical protein